MKQNVRKTEYSEDAERYNLKGAEREQLATRVTVTALEYSRRPYTSYSVRFSSFSDK